MLEQWENDHDSDDLGESDHMSDNPDVDPDATRVKVEEDINICVPTLFQTTC